MRRIFIGATRSKKHRHVRINFDPQAGREQAGARPAIVLSPKRYNAILRLCVLCPVTSQEKGYPFEVKIPAGHAVTGVVTPDGDRLDVLVTLVEAWEAKHYPLDLPDTLEAIKAVMQCGRP